MLKDLKSISLREGNFHKCAPLLLNRIMETDSPFGPTYIYIYSTFYCNNNKMMTVNEVSVFGMHYINIRLY
jgi:hypothetical protein